MELNKILKEIYNNTLSERNIQKSDTEIGFKYFIFDNFIKNEFEEIEAEFHPKHKLFNLGFIEENELFIYKVYFSNLVTQENLENFADDICEYLKSISLGKTNVEEYNHIGNEFFEIINSGIKEIKVNINFIISTNLPNPLEVTKLIKKLKNRIKKIFGNFDATVNAIPKFFGIAELIPSMMKFYYEEGVSEELELKIKSENSLLNDGVLKFKNEDENNYIYLSLIDGNSLRKLYKKLEEQGNLSSLFSWNVREYIEDKNVDAKIRDTLKNDPYDFFVKNNGLTIIGEDIKIENGNFLITNMCIINGAQTTSLIGTAENVDFEKVAVFAKIIDISNISSEKGTFISSISVATNNQKPIKTEDLLSQSLLIRDFEAKFNNNFAIAKINKYFIIKRSSFIKQEVKLLGKKSFTIESFIKTNLMSLMSLPGTAKNAYKAFLASDIKNLTVNKMFSYDLDNTNEFLFVNDMLEIETIVKDYLTLKLKELKSAKNSVDLEVEFVKHAKNFIFTLIINLHYILKDNLYYEKLVDFPEEITDYILAHRNILFQEIIKGNTIEKSRKVNSFLDNIWGKLLIAFTKVLDNTESIANVVKKDSKFKVFFRKFVRENYLMPSDPQIKEIIIAFFSN